MTPDPAPDHPLVAALGLERHPEGGWFRRTWTSDLVVDHVTDRRAGSAIYYLLVDGEVSAWHRLTDADELWHFHDGAALELRRFDGEREEVVVLGPDVAAGHEPQALVPRGWWQSATTTGGHTLVSCSVTPEFRLESFELAPPCWSPGADTA